LLTHFDGDGNMYYAIKLGDGLNHKLPKNTSAMKSQSTADRQCY